jgi:hypothetical protein
MQIKSGYAGLDGERGLLAAEKGELSPVISLMLG